MKAAAQEVKGYVECEAAVCPPFAQLPYAFAIQFQEVPFYEAVQFRVGGCEANEVEENEAHARLRVDTVENMVHGGKSGPALKRGDPDGSLLMARVAPKQPEDRMPPEHE